jgi:hypothetical protein
VYDLYDLETSQWKLFTISSQCHYLGCQVAGIGRYWAEVDSPSLDPGHEPDQLYLQNIQTGAFQPEPVVTPGGRMFVDLNAPSGTSQLCAPLRYPQAYFFRGEPGVGELTFHGRFALTLGGPLTTLPYFGEYRLRRCGSNLNLPLGSSESSGPPLVSSRAVILIPGTPTTNVVTGWLLPSLRRFAAYVPAATRAPCTPGKYFNQGPPGGGVAPVAVTARKIYVKPVCGRQAIWAADLPSPGSH